MPDNNFNLDYDYIKKAIDDSLKANIFLINGVALTGEILDQDDECIIMTCTSKNTATGKQLVFKSAISTIVT